MSDSFPFNGINGDRGSYLTTNLLDRIQKLVDDAQQSEIPQEENIAELAKRAHDSKESWRFHGDTKDLSKTGWGVIFADKADPAIREALSPLLKHREQQVGTLYKEFSGPQGFRLRDTKSKFLERHGVGPGAITESSAQKVPYYLLIVGDPETLPYSFQYQLDVQYGVGRIYFDSLDDYDRYARSVVAAETGQIVRSKRMGFFGTRNPDDEATTQSADNLIVPLVEEINAMLSKSTQKYQHDIHQLPAKIEELRQRQDKQKELNRLEGDLADAKASLPLWTGWSVEQRLAEQATCTELSRWLGGDLTPALMMVACHGMGFDNGSPRQLAHQGALLCQDWPGPLQHKGPIPEDYYLSADKIAANADLAGLIAFAFACYGAGTPKFNDFAFGDNKREQIAPHAFLSRLPQRLLAGGALAMVGHVERAWGYSFSWGRSNAQLKTFSTMFEFLLGGHPIGAALDWFNERYAELSTTVSEQLQQAENGQKIDTKELARIWTANNDARNYVVLGDPAVRLAIGLNDATPPTKPFVANIAAPKTNRNVPIPAEPVSMSVRNKGPILHRVLEKKDKPEQPVPSQPQPILDVAKLATKAPVPTEPVSKGNIKSEDRPATHQAPESPNAFDQETPAGPQTNSNTPLPAEPTGIAVPATEPHTTPAPAPQAEPVGPTTDTQDAPTQPPPLLNLSAASTPALTRAQNSIAEALALLAERLGITLQQVADGATTLEVATYTSEHGTHTSYDHASGQLHGDAQLRAFTRIGLDGRTIVCVPEKNGALDLPTWEIHSKIVAEAATRQADLLRQVLTITNETLRALEATRGRIED